MCEINGRERKENAGKAASDKWGYVVCFGTVITFIAGIGHVNSFGLIYNGFMNETHSTANSLTTAHGVFAVMLAVGGIILNIFSKTYSLRSGGLIGAVLMIFGSLATIAISNTNQLPITFGVLQGIGFGMMVPVCYSTLNLHFVKRRTTVMSFCKAIQGTILMWYPYLMKLILSTYGFRGTLIILSGISFHTIPGMLVMKPKITTTTRIRTANDPENVKTSYDVENLINDRNKQLLEDNRDETGKEVASGKRQRLESVLHLLSVHFIKDLVFCNICIGMSFVNFSDLMFFILQPMLLFQYGYSTMQVATIISICAGFDVAGRFLLALMSSLLTINTRVLYYAATFFTLFIRIVILQLQDFIWVAALTGALGILRAWLHVASPLVIASHVSHDDFPGAYALFMLATGLVNVLIAPGIGLLKDFYEDYLPAFYALSLCCIPCLILWPIEYVCRNKISS